jgi:hypothetical protein
MNPIKQLHREAMDFFDRAEVAQIRGRTDDVPSLLLQAYEKEREAAELVKDRLDLEPTRSVLFRSAAALAKRCNRLREAEQLIGLGLAGNTPPEIAEELRNLFEEINYRRHLGAKGYKVSSSAFQMSFAGSEIGPGMAEKDEVINRIQWISTNVYRTAQRKRGDPFTPGGIPKKLKKEFKIEIYVPMAASFAVAFRLLYLPPKEQPVLPGMGWWPEEVIDELMTCIALLQSEDTPNLKERFQEEAYLTSFLELSKLVAPDGDRVKLVGFTSWQDGRERQVVFDKPAKSLRDFTKSIMPETLEERTIETVTVEGRLLRADSTNLDKGRQLQVLDDTNKRHNIVIKEGGGDIIRALYEESVIVRGEFDGEQIINAIIEPAS